MTETKEKALKIIANIIDSHIYNCSGEELINIIRAIIETDYETTLNQSDKSDILTQLNKLHPEYNSNNSSIEPFDYHTTMTYNNDKSKLICDNKN